MWRSGALGVSGSAHRPIRLAVRHQGHGVLGALEGWMSPTEGDGMEMYTTDTAPGSSFLTAERAWLVWSEAGELDESFASLEERASERGADTIVGLRVTVACTPAFEIDGKWIPERWRYTTYGTALKRQRATAR